MSSIYYVVESKILKIHSKIFFHIFTSEDIDHVIISRQLFCVFKMAMFVRGANQFSHLFKEKTTCLCRKNGIGTRKQ